MVQLETREVVVSGVRFRYLERVAASASSEAPLLLLHGLLATAETFAVFMEALRAGRRVVALDLLSVEAAVLGDIDRAPAIPKLNVSLAPLAGMVCLFMRAVGLTAAVLIGHSHGGLLGLQIAAAAPELLSGLCLLCPAHPFSGYRAHVVAFYLKPLGRALALSIPLAPNWAILRAFQAAAGPKHRVTYRQLRLYLPVLRDRDSLRRVLEMLRTWEADMDDLRDRLREQPLLLPTMLLWGDCDEIVPLASAGELQKHLGNWNQVCLPGVGHLLMEEAPGECAHLIGEWLLRLPQPNAICDLQESEIRPKEEWIHPRTVAPS